MKIDRRDLESNLPKKGFVKDKSGDHIYFHHMWEGRETGAYTKVSHTKKMRDIAGGLLTAIKSQLRLQTNEEVAELVACPMIEEQYVERLVVRGVITRAETERDE